MVARRTGPGEGEGFDPVVLRDVGRTIATRRTARHLTQRAVAEYCGLHRTYMSAIEQGKRTPTLATFFLIADALDVRPSDLLRDAGY